jgi:hypothetical protein
MTSAWESTEMPMCGRHSLNCSITCHSPLSSKVRSSVFTVVSHPLSTHSIKSDNSIASRKSPTRDPSATCSGLTLLRILTQWMLILGKMSHASAHSNSDIRLSKNFWKRRHLNWVTETFKQWKKCSQLEKITSINRLEKLIKHPNIAKIERRNSLLMIDIVV